MSKVKPLAARYGAMIVYGPLSTACGSIVRTKDHAVIRVDEKARGTPRGDFTGGHELGHHLLHDVVDHFAQCEGEGAAPAPRGSTEARQAREADQQRHAVEREANHFTAELFMPEAWAAPMCTAPRPTLDDVHRLARRFRTSFRASGIRYVELTSAPCALVYSAGGKIKRSTETQSFPGEIIQRRTRRATSRGLSPKRRRAPTTTARRSVHTAAFSVRPSPIAREPFSRAKSPGTRIADDRTRWRSATALHLERDPPMLSASIKLSVFLGSLLLVSAPALAHADEPEAPARFGGAGQVALHLNDGVTASTGDLLSGPQVQLDYFVADHVSLGLMAGANWYSNSALNGGGNSFVVRVGPRVGYDIPLSAHVSFWPQVGVDYRSDHETSTITDAAGTPSGASSTSSTTSSFGFAAVAPLVLHPTSAFFIGAGPAFYTQFSNSTSSGGASVDNGKVTSVGLMATIGGAF